MVFPMSERAGIKNALLLSIVIMSASCTTLAEPAPVSPVANVVANDRATEGTYCGSHATTPNYRLWQTIAETSTVTTEIRQNADGSTRYCIKVDTADDPLVLGSTSCAPTPDQAIITFAYEFAAYLCGVTND